MNDITQALSKDEVDDTAEEVDHDEGSGDSRSDHGPPYSPQ